MAIKTSIDSNSGKKFNILISFLSRFPLNLEKRYLWDMLRFYLEYKDHEKLQYIVAEIG
jgi:hypothetical protein